MHAMGVIMGLASAVLVVLVATGQLTGASAEEGECKVWLVESIPTDMPELRPVPGVLRTADVLQWLAGNATSLDLISQYWELNSSPRNPRSGEYGFSDQDMATFGVSAGKAVYASLIAAADRGVPIRILQHSGFFPNFAAESAEIAAGRANVQNRKLLLRDWWGSGVMRTKLWMVNREDAYLGSANNDWKSLTQV